jgi:hypothetical protein
MSALAVMNGQAGMPVRYLASVNRSLTGTPAHPVDRRGTPRRVVGFAIAFGAQGGLV